MWGLAASVVLIVGLAIVVAILVALAGLLIVMVDRRAKRRI